ncbi:MAG TPA: PH domain-containing protein [Acidimicrobiales bacterium]
MSETRRPDPPEPEAAASDQPQSESDDEVVLDLFGRPYQRAPAFPVEKSGDPLGGHPVEEPTRFWWSRRRRSSTYDDGIPTAPLQDPAPVSRSVLGERLSALRNRYFPTPDEVIPTYLGSGEQVLHTDHPSFRFFVVDKLLYILILIGAVGGGFYCLARGWDWPALALFVVAVVVLVMLVFMRVADKYRSYVITNARMMRIEGVLSRRIESIPWVRVTDVHFRQSALERMLGYATLDIESANETMGLRHMQGIADPVTFNQHLMDMVVAKQGPATPLGRRSEYNILQEDRSFFARRRRRKAAERRRRLILDDGPEAGTEGPREDATEQLPGTIGSGSTAATPGATPEDEPDSDI